VPDSEIETIYTAPYSGSNAWWTSSADDLNTTLARTMNLSGISKATVTAKAWYEIEDGYDYLYAEYSTDGDTWKQIGSPISGSTNG
jgi:immune inhibitor A